MLFYDRAISSFFPYILNQFPRLKEEFSGFVYYPNTLSFGGDTLLAAPAMMGGYEYTPEGMNKRPNELLRDKHNESMLLLPRLFNDKGWHVTVTDPPYSNYEWSGDATPFAPYPNTECKFVEGSFYTPYMESIFGGDDVDKGQVVKAHATGFAVLQAVPPFFRFLVYDGADYLQGSHAPIKCIAEYAHLYFLPQTTDAQAAFSTYTFIANDLTHTPTLLQEDDGNALSYAPSANVDAKTARAGSYQWHNMDDLEYYQVNAAAMLLTAQWLNKLRSDGIYDNTRIIIVSDHGKSIATPAWPAGVASHANINPLLLVKDFGATGAVKTDNSLMTNADVPFLATQGLSLDNRNPFTGEMLMQSAQKHEVQVLSADADNPDIKKAHRYLVRDGYRVKDNIFNEANWEKLCYNTIDE